MDAHRRRLAVVAVLLLAQGCTIGADILSRPYADSEQRVFRVGGVPQLRITTLRTPVEIRGWDRQEVQMTLERRAHDKKAASLLEFRVDQQGQVITVDVRRPFGGERVNGWDQIVEGRLVIMAPSSSVIRAQTGAGAIDAANVSGQLDLQTARGDINVAGVLTAVDAHSRSGSIAVRAERGSSTDRLWSFDTIRGSILVECAHALQPRISAYSKRGSVVVRALRS